MRRVTPMSAIGQYSSDAVKSPAKHMGGRSVWCRTDRKCFGCADLIADGDCAGCDHFFDFTVIVAQRVFKDVAGMFTQQRRRC